MTMFLCGESMVGEVATSIPEDLKFCAWCGGADYLEEAGGLLSCRCGNLTSDKGPMAVVALDETGKWLALRVALPPFEYDSVWVDEDGIAKCSEQT